MKKMLVLTIFIILLNPLFAQRPDVKQPVQDAMQRISAMIGTWEGSGWQMGPTGEKESSNVHEEIQFKLDSTLLHIEGLGKKDDGTIVHNALGVISYNAFTKKYVFNAYLSDGLSTVANFEVIEDNAHFRWWFNDNRGGTIRYTITLRNSEWKEIGEYSSDGENWRQFFEMVLKKVQ